jgi:hypothetical protein
MSESDQSESPLEEEAEETWGHGEPRQTGGDLGGDDADGQTNSTEDTKPIPDESDGDVSSDTTDRVDNKQQEKHADPEDITGDTVRQMALAAEELTVRDLRNLNVYLFPKIEREMHRVHKLLDAEFYDQHGSDLDMNKHFFNAIFRVALRNDEELREELELTD